MIIPLVRYIAKAIPLKVHFISLEVDEDGATKLVFKNTTNVVIKSLDRSPILSMLILACYHHSFSIDLFMSECILYSSY